MAILQFSEHFQLIFDNTNVSNGKKIKQKILNFFFCNIFRIIKFLFLILLIKSALDSKVAPNKHNSSAFLLHSRKTFSNVELFSIFVTNFLELIFATKIKTMLLLFYLLAVKKKILRILCVWTLKILYTNKRILT